MKFRNLCPPQTLLTLSLAGALGTLLLVANAGEAMGGEKAAFAAFRSLVSSVAEPA
jgi:hypothetical protein